MGAYQNNVQSDGKKAGSRGSVKNSSRLDGFASGRKKGSADWGTADPELVLATVLKITGMGGAITFGLSRDEGAHSLTLMLDDSRATLWFNGDADLNTELQEVCARLEAEA